MASNNDAKETLRNENNDSMRNENTDLLEYVQLMQGKNILDDEKTVENFITKLKQPIEYKAYLNEFKWTKKYFTKLDNILTELGYAGHSDAIIEIREFIKNKLRMIDVLDYNSAMERDEKIINLCTEQGKNYDECCDIISFIRYDDSQNQILDNPIKNHFYTLSLRVEKIDWETLSDNPAAFGLIKRLECVDKKLFRLINWNAVSEWTNDLEHIMGIGLFEWNNISKNPYAIGMIEDYIKDRKKQNIPDHLDWSKLAMNPAAVGIIKNILSDSKDPNYHKIDWRALSTNPKAIDILRENQDKIYWSLLSSVPEAIELLTENQDKIDWEALSGNPAGIDLLKANPEKIDWWELSGNPSPAAVEILMANKDKLYWNRFSGNPRAMELLKADPRRIDWSWFSKNPLATDYIRWHTRNIDWEAFSDNSYDYYREKLDHFNSMDYFPLSKLIITDYTYKNWMINP